MQIVLMRAEPAHGELRILDLCGPGIGEREPVVDGGDDKALGGETHAEIEKRVSLNVEFGALIPHRGATAMNEDNTWQWRRRADRLAEVECLQRRRTIRDITAQLRVVAWREQVAGRRDGRGRRRRLPRWRRGSSARRQNQEHEETAEE
jgi:hypothetical protein